MRACQIEKGMNTKSFELIKSINRKMHFFYMKRITFKSIVVIILYKRESIFQFHNNPTM